MPPPQNSLPSPPTAQKLVAQQPTQRAPPRLLVRGLLDAGAFAAGLGLEAAPQLLDAGAGHRAADGPPRHPPRRERHQLVAVCHAGRPAHQRGQQRVRELRQRELQRHDVRRRFGGQR